MLEANLQWIGNLSMDSYRLLNPFNTRALETEIKHTGLEVISDLPLEV